MKNIMFIAPPAAGKGTQAELIVEKYHIPHISTGNILRDISKENSEIGNYIYETLASGNLVKDEITYKLVEDRLSKEDCQNGFIIDGFPRNYEQALKYDEILNDLNQDIGYVFLIDVDKKILESRITGRRICEKCQAVYNINVPTQKSKVESICDKCGGNLYQRKDDNLEAFKIRYNNYLEKTAPIIKHYELLHVLYHIDGNGKTEDIFEQIENIINKEDGE
ncbi:MAG: adenylate kinase [Bacilli bacterium]|nr:adenylate kinase [Bacilli bacterium]